MSEQEKFDRLLKAECLAEVQTRQHDADLGGEVCGELGYEHLKMPMSDGFSINLDGEVHYGPWPTNGHSSEMFRAIDPDSMRTIVAKMDQFLEAERSYRQKMHNEMSEIMKKRDSARVGVEEEYRNYSARIGGVVCVYGPSVVYEDGI